MESGRNADLELLRYTKVCQLMSSNYHLKEQIESLKNEEEALQLLENLLRNHPNLYELLVKTVHRPTIREVLALCNSQEAINKLCDYMSRKTIQQTFYSKYITSEDFIACMRLSNAEISSLQQLFEQSRALHFLAEHKGFPMGLLLNLTVDQKTTLLDPVIQQYIYPLLMPDPIDILSKQVPVLTIERALTLTAAERSKLASNLFYIPLCKKELSVDQVLSMNANVTTKAQVAAIVADIKYYKFIETYIPGLSKADADKLRGLPEYIIFIELNTSTLDVNDSENKHQERNNKNLKAVLDLTDEERARIKKVNPETLLKLFFRCNAIPLREILNLTKDQVDFFKMAINKDEWLEVMKQPNGFYELYNQYASNKPDSPATKEPSEMDSTIKSYTDQLTRYLSRIKALPLEPQKSDFENFRMPFMRGSRGINRKRNYEIAKQLSIALEALSNDPYCTKEDIARLFNPFSSKGAYVRYGDHTIRSAELNKILKQGMKFSGHMRRGPAI